MPRSSSGSIRVTKGNHDLRASQKKSSFHSFVYDHHGLPLHHLVPLSSERRVQPHPADHTTPESGRPTESGIYEPYFAFPKISADSGVGGSISEEYPSEDSEGEEEEEADNLEYPATMTLERSSYRESISFGVVERPCAPHRRCLSVLNQQEGSAAPRIKEAVIFGPGLRPVSYQNRVTVAVNGTWKRFKSTVNYVPKVKPVGYSSTCYIRPCYSVQRFVALLDSRPEEEADRKWYQCTLELRPKTYSSSKVNCFEMNNNELQDKEDDDNEDLADEQDVFMDNDGMISPHLVNAKVWDYSDASSAPRSFRNSLSSMATAADEPRMHRASIVVNGRATLHDDSEEEEELELEDDDTDDFADGYHHGNNNNHGQQFVDGYINDDIDATNGNLIDTQVNNLGEIVTFDSDPYLVQNGTETDVDGFEYGTLGGDELLLDFGVTTGQQEEVQNGFAGGENEQGSGGMESMDYTGVVHSGGLGKYIQLNGYGGSSGSLEEIDL